jgi:two-component system chemotaxis sensor kinase CheA
VIAFSVTDTGIGIDTQQQQRIFEAFAQGDGTTARRYGGTGLGLSISRELATLLGGEVSVSSVQGRGSTFTVYLPSDGHTQEVRSSIPVQASAAPEHLGSFVQPAQPRPVPSADQRPVLGRNESPIAGVKVLVVDDDIRNIFAMTALLERGHADVRVVESGADALTSLQGAPDVDLVLMDIMMPVMDGYDTIRAIRAMDRFKTLPVIAITGKAMAGERQRCLDAGATDYVPKPVDTAELFAVLRPWLPTTANAVDPSVLPEEPRAERADPPQERSRVNGFEDSPIDGVKILVVDDDFRNIFAMTALLERGHADVLVAESGAEAIAMLDRLPDIDVVLMDIMMPVMDGYDAIRAIRMIDRHKDLPIIAVTGKSASGERQRCLDAGANEYVPKPIDTGELLAAMKPWLPTPAEPAA